MKKHLFVFFFILSLSGFAFDNHDYIYFSSKSAQEKMTPAMAIKKLQAGNQRFVVMGHSNCGAIKGACSQVKLGNLTHLLAQVQPAVLATEKTLHENNCDDANLIDAIAKENVLTTINQIYLQSEVLRNLAESKKIEIVGAMQDLKTGRVQFFDREGKEIR